VHVRQFLTRGRAETGAGPVIALTEPGQDECGLGGASGGASYLGMKGMDWSPGRVSRVTPGPIVLKYLAWGITGPRSACRRVALRRASSSLLCWPGDSPGRVTGGSHCSSRPR
jgi:hypothetical protein